MDFHEPLMILFQWPKLQELLHGSLGDLTWAWAKANPEELTIPDPPWYGGA